MKKMFMNPSIEVKNFQLENIVTGSTTEVDKVVTFENAGAIIDASGLDWTAME